jgi:hypothetical protein
MMMKANGCFWVWALGIACLVFGPSVAAAQELLFVTERNDRLTRFDSKFVGKYFKEFDLNCEAGWTYAIEVVSKDFDTCLFLFDGAGRFMGAGDDVEGGNDPNSRIYVDINQTGRYKVMVTTSSRFVGGRRPFITGDFNLLIRKKPLR